MVMIFLSAAAVPTRNALLAMQNADLLPRALPIKAQKRSMSIRLTARTSLFDRLPTCAERSRVALRRG